MRVRRRDLLLAALLLLVMLRVRRLLLGWVQRLESHLDVLQRYVQTLGDLVPPGAGWTFAPRGEELGVDGSKTRVLIIRPRTACCLAKDDIRLLLLLLRLRKGDVVGGCTVTRLLALRLDVVTAGVSASRSLAADLARRTHAIVRTNLTAATLLALRTFAVVLTNGPAATLFALRTDALVRTNAPAGTLLAVCAAAVVLATAAAKTLLAVGLPGVVHAIPPLALLASSPSPDHVVHRRGIRERPADVISVTQEWEPAVCWCWRPTLLRRRRRRRRRRGISRFHCWNDGPK